MGATRQLREQRRLLLRAWEADREPARSGAATAGVRPEIRASWHRSARTVATDVTLAPMAPDDGTWAASPLRTAVERIVPQLRSAAEDGDLVVAVTDASARILWTHGGRVMQRRAESVNFVAGGRWDEASVGTNALDLALRLRAPATVWSAEHFAPLVQGWVCWAAPVHDPVTGAALGVLDLSTTWDRAHPLGPATATALAGLLQAELPEVGSGTSGSSTGGTGAAEVPGRPRLELRLLGDGEARLDGRHLPVTPRQLEVLALLALHPDGLSLPELHDRLYGEAPVSTSTLKVEVSHLRALLGGAVASRPYRLDLPVRTDVDRVLDAVARGDVAAAAAAYGGDLLPGTESPDLRRTRDYVAVAVREALLARPDPEAVLRYADRCPDDTAVLQAAVAAAPPSAPARALLAARLRAAG